MSNVEELRVLHLAPEPLEVEGGHEGLARARRGDDEIPVAIVELPLDLELSRESRIWWGNGSRSRDKERNSLEEDARRGPPDRTAPRRVLVRSSRSSRRPNSFRSWPGTSRGFGLASAWESRTFHSRRLDHGRVGQVRRADVGGREAGVAVEKPGLRVKPGY